MSFGSILLPVGILIALGIVAVIYFLGDRYFPGEVQQEVAKSLLQFALIGFVGAYAKHLFDQAANERKERETRYRLQIETLNIITDTYWRIRNSLDIIDAHKSAKSYGEQMRAIIELKNVLRRVDNEVFSGMRQFDDKMAITSNLVKLIEQLDELIEEWKKNHLRLSRLQSVDEKESDLDKKRVPHELSQLPVLSAVRHDNFALIHRLFEAIVQPIRRQLGIGPNSTGNSRESSNVPTPTKASQETVEDKPYPG